VRTIAKKFDLPNAEKKDSQGLCFMGKVDMADFLRHYINAQPGDVCDESGRVIGTHDGALLYTIGQRHGLRYPGAISNAGQRYVVSKDIAQNIVVVSPHRPKDTRPSENTQSILVAGGHMISDELIVDNMKVSALFRYRGEREEVTVRQNGELLHVHCSETRERFLSPGQSVVFYSGDECLGGGVMV
jgi:tRNA-specific 2-thiouridylase